MGWLTETENRSDVRFVLLTASGLIAARCYSGLCSGSAALLSWKLKVWIERDRGNKSGLTEEWENLILTDVDKDKTLCASVTGRDNIPKLEKVWGQTDRDMCCQTPKPGAWRTWQNLPYWDNWATDMGVLWLEERSFWCWGDCTARIWQTAKAGGVRTLFYMEYWFNVN